MTIIGLIPARGGSKGIPGKNIKNLAGKPLIAWTIEAALNSKTCSRLIVSTDNLDIKKIAQDWGAEVPFIRPENLSGDTVESILVAHHAINYLLSEGMQKSDYILLLQPTSPLRDEQDIKNVIDIGQLQQAEAVMSVTECPYNPYKTHTISHQGVLQRFITKTFDNVPRQNLPSVYVENGAVYLNRISSLIEKKTFIPENKTVPYIMPLDRSLDIDTPWDLYLAELILHEKQKRCN